MIPASTSDSESVLVAEVVVVEACDAVLVTTAPVVVASVDTLVGIPVVTIIGASGVANSVVVGEDEALAVDPGVVVEVTVEGASVI